LTSPVANAKYLQPNYVPTIEDEIEAERQRKVEELKKLGKGTPVTPETFAAWQERKRKKRAEEIRKTVEAEFRKKKGKGLSVLSGRDLYEFKRDVFKDMDDDAEDGASVGDDNDAEATNGRPNVASNVEDALSAKIQKDLFLDGGDVDLDDLDDD
jgi:DRG Family Regulatory Proteins, Tma46